MEQNLNATYFDEKKQYRLKIYRDTDGYDGPLEWGWKLHYADRDRNYSLDKERNGEPMQELRSIVYHHADADKVRAWLKDKQKRIDNGEPYAEYDRSAGLWRLYVQMWGGKYDMADEFTPKEWREYDSDVVEKAVDCDDAACITIANEMLGDGVKIAHYDFNYYTGESDFCDGADENMRGLVWIEKDDYLKEHLADAEKHWNEEPLTKLFEGLFDSIQRWARGDIYGFVLEKAVNWKIHRECISEEREPEDYEETEWEEVDSCWSYYMEPEELAKEVVSEHSLPPMLEAA